MQDKTILPLIIYNHGVMGKQLMITIQMTATQTNSSTKNILHEVVK